MNDKQSIRVLLVEDNAGDVELIRGILAESNRFRVDMEHSGSLSAGIERMSKEKFDVILSDLGLPDSIGMSTFFEIHKHAHTTPVIVMSGLDDEDIALKAVREGAQDYLVKGSFDGNLLVRSIMYSIERKKLMVQVEKSLKEIKTLQGLIPICAWCKKIRDDQGFWKSVEAYIEEHTAAEFTHGMCPECGEKAIAEFRKIKNAGTAEHGEKNR
jgi:DNA-binding NtrC family response regulator